MFRTVAAGLAMTLGLAGSALAAGPISVDTAFPSVLSNTDPFRDNLLSIGVGVELAPDFFVNVFAPTNLTFRLLESRRAGVNQITELVVDGTSYDVPLQAFSPTGTLLGTQLFSGSFASLGFLTAEMEADPGDPPPVQWPDGFHVYIRSADEANLTGIGPFIGNFDTIYLNIGGDALFEVSTAVPEPATWAMMLSGFALGGAALRRARRKEDARAAPEPGAA